MISPEHSPRNTGRNCIFRLWALALLVLVPAAGAADATATAPQGERVHISADKLVVDNKGKSAVFTGNVNAVQGTTRIRADRLTVFYDTDVSGEDPGGQGTIRRIESEGDVIIHFDDKVAMTRKAIYNKDSGLLELIGEDTRVTSGQNTITGNRIVVDRARDSITVESGGSQRVEAVIFPGESDGGGLLPPAPKKAAAGSPAP